MLNNARNLLIEKNFSLKSRYFSNDPKTNKTSVSEEPFCLSFRLSYDGRILLSRTRGGRALKAMLAIQEQPKWCSCGSQVSAHVFLCMELGRMRIASPLLYTLLTGIFRDFGQNTFVLCHYSVFHENINLCEQAWTIAVFAAGLSRTKTERIRMGVRAYAHTVRDSKLYLENSRRLFIFTVWLISAVSVCFMLLREMHQPGHCLSCNAVLDSPTL